MGSRGCTFGNHSDEILSVFPVPRGCRPLLRSYADGLPCSAEALDPAGFRRGGDLDLPQLDDRFSVDLEIHLRILKRGEARRQSDPHDYAFHGSLVPERLPCWLRSDADVIFPGLRRGQANPRHLGPFRGRSGLGGVEAPPFAAPGVGLDGCLVCRPFDFGCQVCAFFRAGLSNLLPPRCVRGSWPRRADSPVWLRLWPPRRRCAAGRAVDWTRALGVHHARAPLPYLRQSALRRRLLRHLVFSPLRLFRCGISRSAREALWPTTVARGADPRCRRRQGLSTPARRIAFSDGPRAQSIVDRSILSAESCADAACSAAPVTVQYPVFDRILRLSGKKRLRCPPIAPNAA